MTDSNKPRKAIKPAKRERAKTNKGHFVSNANLLRAFRESKAQGKMTDELAKLILTLAENYRRHPWFCRYPECIKDEMMGDAIENLCKKWHLFDDTLSEHPNPFAYYTQACYRSFSAYKKAEKTEMVGRNKLMVAQNLNPSWLEDEDAE